LRSDNLGLSQLLVSRKDTRSVSRYAWTWRETLPCLLIWWLKLYVYMENLIVPLFRDVDWFSHCVYFVSGILAIICIEELIMNV